MTKLPLFHNSNTSKGLMDIIGGLPVASLANLDALDLEDRLMGGRNYFQNRSFTNAHQDVNVYSDLFRDYIVRYSGSSIDVHIKPSK
jgi:hypothetical protein